MLTRCPSCKTIFRIEETHLEAAGGQVRCGRCSAVFDARWSLVPDGSLSPAPPAGTPAATALERIAPLPDQPPAPAGEAAGDGGETPPSREGTTVTRFMEAIGPAGEETVDSAADELAPPPAAAEGGGEPSPPSATGSGGEGAAPETEGAPAPGGERPAAALDEAASLFEEELDLPAPPPAWPWALGSLLLVIALGVQLLLLRPELPASWPPLRPLVESACRLLPCSLPRRLDAGALQVLARDMVEEGETVRIHLSFVNTAAFPQPWPLIEIVLSDARGEALAAGRFPPSVYLEEGEDAAGTLPPRRPAQANLLLERVPGAVSWQFRLLLPGAA